MFARSSQTPVLSALAVVSILALSPAALAQGAAPAEAPPSPRSPELEGNERLEALLAHCRLQQ